MTLRRTKYSRAAGQIVARRLRAGAPRDVACGAVSLSVNGVRQALAHVRSGRSQHPAVIAFAAEVDPVWPQGKPGRPRTTPSKLLPDGGEA